MSKPMNADFFHKLYFTSFLLFFSWYCSSQNATKIPEFDATNPSVNEFRSEQPWQVRLLVSSPDPASADELEKLLADFKKDSDFRIFFLGKDRRSMVVETKKPGILEKIQQGLSKSKFKAIRDQKIRISSLVFSDPLISQQWGLQSTDMNKIWQQETALPKKEIKVAVIDSGIDASHPDIKDNIVAGYDFVHGDSVADDENGHGTHIAGIVAAKANGLGIVGVAPFVKIMPLKVIDHDGNGSLTNLLYAISYAADNGADVINISAGFYANVAQDQELLALVNNHTQYAFQRGVTVVASAGNRALTANVTFLPGFAQNVISVGAHNQQGKQLIAYGQTQPAIYAPGSEILSLRCQTCTLVPASDDPAYGFLSGASQATGFVSGAVAWMKANASAQKITVTIPEAGTILNLAKTNFNLLQVLEYDKLGNPLARPIMYPIKNDTVVNTTSTLPNTGFSGEWAQVGNDVSSKITNFQSHTKTFLFEENGILYTQVDNFLKKWNGIDWETITALPLLNGSNIGVQDAAYSGGKFYIISSSANAEGANLQLLVYENGTWSNKGNFAFALPEFSQHVTGTLAVGEDGVYIAFMQREYISKVPPVSWRNYFFARKWNGASFETLGGNLAYDTDMVGDVIAPKIAIVNNTPHISWLEVSVGNSNSPDWYMNGTFRLYANKWDGSAWQPIGNQLNQNGNLFIQDFVLTQESNALYFVWTEKNVTNPINSYIRIRKLDNGALEDFSSRLENRYYSLIEAAALDSRVYVGRSFGGSADGGYITSHDANSVRCESNTFYPSASLQTPFLSSLLIAENQLFAGLSTNSYLGGGNFLRKASVQKKPLAGPPVSINEGPYCRMQISEPGAGAQYNIPDAQPYTIRLDKQPQQNVQIKITPESGLKVNDSTEPITITFESTNWNVAKSITVRALQNSIDEGQIYWKFIKHEIITQDSEYANVKIRDVPVSIWNDDVAKFNVLQTEGNTAVVEGGTADSYTIKLNSEPLADVRVTVTPDTQLKVNAVASPTELIFTATNWNQGQTVSVTAIADSISEGNHIGRIRHTLASSDSKYAVLVIPEISVAIAESTEDLLQAKQNLAAAQQASQQAVTTANSVVANQTSAGALTQSVNAAFSQIQSAAQASEAVKESVNSTAIQNAANQANLITQQRLDLQRQQQQLEQRLLQERLRNQIACGGCSPNPVRLATGLKDGANKDLAIPFGDEAMQITRRYSINNKNNFSLGRGWFFNYDTRIIRGVSGTAQIKTQTEAVLQLAQTTLATVNNLQTLVSAGQTTLANLIVTSNEQMQIMTTNLSTLTQLQSTTQALADSVISYRNQTITFKDATVLHANASGSPEAPGIIAAAQQAMVLAEDALQRAQIAYAAIVTAAASGQITANDAQVLMTRMLSIQAELGPITVDLQNVNTTLSMQVAELTFEIQSMEGDVQKDLADAQKNLSAIDPAHLAEQEFGNGFIKWIDEQGNGRIFRVFADGTTEPFDKASTPAQNRVTLTITATGYTVQRVDGLTYQYNSDGILTQKRDRNGLALYFRYTLENRGEQNGYFKYALREIEDTFGRKTLFQFQNGHIAAVTDPLGRTIRYAYNEQNVLERVFDPADQALSYTYGLSGVPAADLALTKIVDRKGAVREYKYEIINDLPRVTEEIDPLGNKMRFSYDFTSRITWMTDRRGLTTTFYHNDRGSTISTTWPDGSSVSSVYDERQNPVTTTDENGNATQYEYSTDNLVTKILFANGAAQQFSYDNHGLLSATTDALGKTLVLVRDSRGNLVETRMPDGGVRRYEYNGLGFRTKEIDANGNATSFTYDAYGNLKLSTLPNGAVTEYGFDIMGRLQTVRNPDGGVIAVAYDNLDRIAFSIDPLGRKTEFHYSANGELLERIVKATAGAPDRIYTFAYNAMGRVVSATQPGDFTANMAYDPEENLIVTKFNASTALSNQTIEFVRSYDARGRLTEVKQPDFSVTSSMQYDRASNLIAVTDALGNQTRRSYDNLNRLVEEANALGAKTRIEYDANNQPNKVTDPLGREITLLRDSVGRVVRVVNPLAQSVESVYDKMGNLLEMKDTAGRSSRFVYNELNAVTKAIDALGGQTIYAYDLKGRLIRSIAPNGGQTSVAYDALDRMTQMTDPLGGVMSQEYDDFDNVRRSTNQNGESMQYAYDIRDRLTRLSDPLGNQTTMEYDSFDRMTAITNAMDEKTRYSYDLIGRLLTITTPMGHESKFEYDKLSRKTAAIDALGRRTQYGYDALGRLTAVTDPLGKSIVYNYDLANNLVKMLDAKNNPTYFDYDALQRLVAKTNAMGQKTQYNYDAAGNLSERIWADGGKANYAYDELNRLVQRAYSDPSTPLSADSRVDSYAYDEMGNLIRAANGNATETYEYDLANRATNVTNWTLGKEFNYEYDKVGRRTKMSLVKTPEELELPRCREYAQQIHKAHHRHAKGIIGGFRHFAKNWFRHIDDAAERLATEYSYDAAGRMLKIDGPQFLQANTYFEYDKVGRRTAKKLANGVTTDYSYDRDSRLTQIKDRGRFGQNVLRFDYEYDKAGNITARGREDGTRETMGYDDLNRLTSYQKDRDVSAYTYDAGGNRISESKNGQVTYASYNELNQIIQRGATQYQYDQRGNRSKKITGSQTTQYQYNGENQLTGVTLPNANQMNFAFDALDRRVSKQFTQRQHTSPHGWPSGYRDDDRHGARTKTVTNYSGYDGRQTLYELDEDHSAMKLYHYKPGAGETDGSPYGELISQRSFDTDGRKRWGAKSRGSFDRAMYYHQDGLGSTYKMTDSRGKTELEYDYDAWGKITNDEDTEPYNHFLYTGKEFDGETGLTHMDARAYDPETGTFLQGDPLNLATLQLPAAAQGIAAMGMSQDLQLLANPHQFMSYGYVAMNPMRYNDPSGLFFGAIGNFFSGIGRGIGNFAVNTFQRAANFVTGNGWNTNAQAAQQRAREAAAQRAAEAARRATKQKAEAPISSRIGSFVSTIGRGLGIGAKKALEWVIGDNYGQAWGETFGRGAGWQNVMLEETKWKLPASLAEGITGVFKRVEKEVPDAAANGMHAWHAGSNAMGVEKLGILGLIPIMGIGILHETPVDWGSFKKEDKQQGKVNHFLDSTTDIVANVFGMTLGIILPDSISVTAAMKLGNYIPGPGDPWRKVGGKHKPYTGNPTDNWGPYTKMECP